MTCMYVTLCPELPVNVVGHLTLTLPLMRINISKYVSHFVACITNQHRDCARDFLSNNVKVLDPDTRSRIFMDRPSSFVLISITQLLLLAMRRFL